MTEWHKMEFADHEVEPVDTCDLCGATRRSGQRLFTKYGLPVVKCRQCGLMYVSPRLRQDILWQRYSEDFFQNEYLPQHGDYDERRNYDLHAPYLRELRRYIPAGGRMFEFGAAIGLFLAAARLDGWEVVGNELSPFAAEYARTHFGIEVLPGNAEEINLPPGSFDAVVMWEMIEHVQSPQAVLRKAAELLQPGGVLALSTPNAGGVTYRLLKARWWIIAPKEHLFYFAPRTLMRSFRAHGFEVKKWWTAGLDLHYLRKMVMGQEVQPIHIRLSGPARNQPPGSSAGRGLGRTWIEKVWARAGPKIERVLVPAVARMRWSDTIYAYALRMGS